MDLATGTLPGKAQKGLHPGAWGEFLKRVLVSTASGSRAEDRVRDADEATPRPSPAPGRRGEPPAER